MTASSANARSPQQERSRLTRERLLRSTVDALAADGWSAATVAAVAERAGVSRGAAQHHFPTRETLITAALEQVFEDMTRATGGAPDASSERADGVTPSRVIRAVQRAVDVYTGTEFKAALQVWAAAASDPALRRLILPLEAKFARAAHQRTMAAMGVSPDDETGFRLVQATLDMARGLGLADTLSDDSARRALVVDTWSAQLVAALGSD
ncbi:MULTISPECIES: TetR/AcrR family transcriptional regulator [Gordonia]|jgi:AcrR family transcriptional regulator|uniref:TetR/AcrR family transcriptional regulator n=2 Tax=Gordonia terrae TaxID=2055 RepID=A0A2I1R2I3_9ACTN|nr:MULTISPECIES: TetR/AcrR family transcriptional regulator [Gordonia]VTR11864.1 transcriptional regulator BetI [Clostridioides difficile]ANY24734.1 TetR family transcriptional regulator [Gordonia terrae]AWO85480.1 TetR/AcrR family transcriptional regulator [Gordonia terrae]PKZ63337.1 TetR/AcrR family transcriptional regulator [Gordonia terrae]UPW08218.1 TetR/AcrR family transcriptional regulator [Gordonia terrae]